MVILDIPRTVVVYICIGMCIWYDVFEICSPPVSTGKFSLPACSCLLPSDITQLCYMCIVRFLFGQKASRQQIGTQVIS